MGHVLAAEKVLRKMGIHLSRCIMLGRISYSVLHQTYAKRCVRIWE